MKLKIWHLLTLFLLFFTQSCAPRGETKTLNEILTESKIKFNLAVANNNETEIQQLKKALDKLEDGTASAKEIDLAISSLQKLSTKAGFTNRPALAEILKQYLAFKNKSQAKQKVIAKLLVARTYRAITRELESTQFNM